ncbi:MAG: hypothetical protein V4750_17295, partial [Pseudomonadota bacterium]
MNLFEARHELQSPRKGIEVILAQGSMAEAAPRSVVIAGPPTCHRPRNHDGTLDFTTPHARS